MELQSSGALAGNDEAHQLKRSMQIATEAHAKTMTPYGPVVQEVQLDAPQLPKWDICHPFAFLWHLTMISEGFRTVTNSICTPGHRVLRLIIYADELVPGNPFRPEKSRTLMCIYWAFVDWPSWLLTRTFAWPCLSILRSTIIKSLPGGMTYLARIILRLFFPKSGESMNSGILIQSPDGPLLVKCKFVGWLADLAGHKEITEWKGVGGIVCCMDCGNIHKSLRGRAANGQVGLDCCDFSDSTVFDRRSDADLWAVIDYIADHSESANLGELQKLLGVNFEPTGILFDKTLRDIYLPVSHSIRDWQHTMLQDGVANTCIGTILDMINAKGYTNDQVRAFMMLCNLPSKHGKPNANWLNDNRIKKTKIVSFSSIILNLLPILYLFLTKFCTSDPELADVLRCFTLLCTICGVLAAGPDEAPKHVAVLRRMMVEYHTLVVAMCFHLKPKIHHMHHILDGMVWLGKLLSCFVCERKHRTIKDSALHVFRHIEHTVLADVVNKQCHQMISGIDIFKKQFLVDARKMIDVPGLLRSRKAVLIIGSTHSGDIVWLKDAKCGRVHLFYELSGSMIVSLHLFNNVANDPSLFEERQSIELFIDPCQIVDACTWYYESPGIVRVAIPPVVLMA